MQIFLGGVTHCCNYFYFSVNEFVIFEKQRKQRKEEEYDLGEISKIQCHLPWVGKEQKELLESL